MVTKTKAPGMLHPAFHDAGTFEKEENSGGMNGTIILELDRPENSGLLSVKHQELIVLSGAHTIGGKGFGNPTVFDNSYFEVLLEKPWTSSGGMSSMVGRPSDHAFAQDEECIRWITAYAGDPMQFFEDFKRAYIKLLYSVAKWKNA